MQVLDCLKMLASKLPDDDKDTFLTFLSQTLLGESSNMAHQLREFPQGVDRSRLKTLLTGYLTLNKAGLLKPALKVCAEYVVFCVALVVLWRWLCWHEFTIFHYVL